MLSSIDNHTEQTKWMVKPEINHLQAERKSSDERVYHKIIQQDSPYQLCRFMDQNPNVSIEKYLQTIQKIDGVKILQYLCERNTFQMKTS